jgi:hypothetical protein
LAALSFDDILAAPTAAPVARATASQQSGALNFDDLIAAPKTSVYDLPPPPPGAIVHGVTSDYVADQPNISAPRTDNTGGKASQIQDMTLLDRAKLEPMRSQLPFDNAVLPLGVGSKLGSAMAGVGATLSGGSFSDEYAAHELAMKQALAQQQAEHPTQSAITGAVGSLPLALTAGSVATKAANAAGGSAGAQMVTNALAGGGLGAAYGADRGPGGALSGAGWGSLLGAASVPLGALATKVITPAARAVANALYGNRFGAALPGQAADSLNSVLARQGDTGASALQSVQDMGSGATLADSGPATQQFTARLAAQDPNVAPAIQSNLTDRADQFAPRMGAAADAAAGPDINAVQQLQQLKATTAANGNANYDAALNNGQTVNVTPVMAHVDQQTIEPALAGTTPDPISAALTKARGYFAGNAPDALPMNIAHRAQDVINDDATAAFQRGDNAQARALWQTRDKLLDQMDNASPAYAQARAQFASDRALENAFQNGRSVFAPRVEGQVYDPDLLESQLAKMSQPEQRSFQLGVRKALADTMGEARTNAMGVRTRLANENGYPVQKLKQVIGEPQTNALLKELDNQATMQETNRRAFQGSDTAMRNAVDADIPTAHLIGGKVAAAAHTGSGGVGYLVGQEFGGHIGALVGHKEAGEMAGLALAPAFGAGSKAIANSINAGRQSSQDAARDAIARALTSSPPPNIGPALAARQNMASIPDNVSEGARKLIQALALRQGTTAPPDWRQYLPSSMAP